MEWTDVLRIYLSTGCSDNAVLITHWSLGDVALMINQ